MRSAYYTLGAIMVVLAGLAVVLSLSTGSPTEKNQPPRPLVYVDTDQLVELHPGSLVLARMKSLAGASGLRGDASSGQLSARRAGDLPLGGVIEPPDVSRQDIEAEIAQSAAMALSKLESDEMQALQARMRASKATMMENARADIVAQVREIDRTAAFKERSLVAQLGPDRLTTQIKSNTLQTSLSAMSKVTGVKPESAKPGDTLKAMLADLQMTDIELKRINDTLASESVNIKAEALERIAKLREASTAEIESKLSATEAKERSTIESGIAAARSEILTELSSSDSVPGVVQLQMPVEPAKATVTIAPRTSSPSRRISRLSTGARTAQGDGTIRSQVAAMDARIKADIVRAVRALAAKEHVRVTFVRSAKTIPDATARFAARLKAGGASIWGPVIAESSQSSVSAGASPSRRRG